MSLGTSMGFFHNGHAQSYSHQSQESHLPIPYLTFPMVAIDSTLLSILWVDGKEQTDEEALQLLNGSLGLHPKMGKLKFSMEADCQWREATGQC